jgi:hypothetical protein
MYIYPIGYDVPKLIACLFKKKLIFETAQVPPGKTPAVQGYLNSKSDTNKIEGKKNKK